MTEQEIINRLADAEREVVDAKKALAEAKRRWTDAETDLISAKIARDRIKEELRVHRKTTPRYEPSLRDLDIKRFQEDHPELCKWARERDGIKDDEE